MLNVHCLQLRTHNVLCSHIMNIPTHCVLNTDCQSEITKYIDRIKLRLYKGKGHPTTCLYRHRGEEEIRLQRTGNLGVSGGGG